MRSKPSPESVAKARVLAGAHLDCEDPWYSCPKSEDGCANESVGDRCTCGVEQRIDAIALALDAERAAGKAEGRAEGMEEAAVVAKACEYPHPKDMLAKNGRGWFYQSNILSAWRQAGNAMARAIRARAKEAAK